MTEKGEDKSLKSSVAQKEEEILEFWNKNEIFKKSLEKEAPNGSFVFFDGPPFATGLPHYGHILPGTIKDIIPRYQTMKGKKVLRRWGWDCHGLPIENLVEKELGLSSKKDIEAYGVEKFNLASRSAVFRYVDEWKKIIPRSGRWIDMDDSYQTMDSAYTESVWWSFKTLFEKGLVYQDFKSMLLCPHCETTLSNFEVNQGYKDITDISVYVKFALKDEENTFVLAWTTTPWTLPGNVALAVNKETVYVKAKKDENFYILAKDLTEKVLKENFEIMEEFSGDKLIGKAYTPIFDYYNNEKLENKDRAWKVYHGDFVTTESGTGVVHIAPAFGEDDMNLGKDNKLPFIQHVEKDGTFKIDVTDFAGQKVKPIEDNQKADVEIIKYLAKNNVLFSKEKIVHSYPHCWRCGTPLLNYATTSWFVKVTDMKDRLVDINKGVSWTPEEIGEGRFGKWLEGARDWAISRSRYWGAPLPVWEKENGDKEIVGSIEELKKKIKSNKNHFIILRHGEAEHNVGHFVSCKKEDEVHLTNDGIKKINEVAQILSEKKIDAIYASPFVRTKETVEIVSEKIGIKDIVFDDRLVEYGFGDFCDQSFKDFLDYEEENMKDYSTPVPNGESYLDSKKRFGEFLYDIDSKHKEETILVVTHGIGHEVLPAVLEGANNKRSKYIMNHSDHYTPGSMMEFDFSPIPHNENYELDLHRPYIDQVILVDENGKEMKRVPEVFDTWYDSGSMSFAQQHYPFENKELFEKDDSPFFPADFIAEGLDQTRGWFYTLLVMATGLFDKSPYKHVLVNGLVLAEDGRKMSKSLKNYPDLMEVVHKYGADALRYYLVSSPLVKAEDFNFSEKGVDDISKKLIQKVYNVLSFYEMYPVENNSKPEPSILDSWIISRLDQLTETITKSLDKYEIDKASRPIMDFVDDLSTWYLRRSRERFKSERKTERDKASYYTKFILLEFSKITAPFMPFMAEEVYRRVGGEKESVHLEDWRNFGEVDVALVSEMEKVREVVSSALELRQRSGHKVRQPLSQLTIPTSFSREFLNIISDEVNVKEVVVGGAEIKLDTSLTVELKNEGVARDVIRGIQDARKSEGLTPSDNISLVVNASDEVHKILKSFDQMIKLPTQVTEINFSDEKGKYEIKLENEVVSITILK